MLDTTMKNQVLSARYNNEKSGSAFKETDRVRLLGKIREHYKYQNFLNSNTFSRYDTSFYFFNLCIQVFAYMYMCILYAFLLSKETRRGHWIPRNWS